LYFKHWWNMHLASNISSKLFKLIPNTCLHHFPAMSLFLPSVGNCDSQTLGQPLPICHPEPVSVAPTAPLLLLLLLLRLLLLLLLLLLLMLLMSTMGQEVAKR
jgi:hypothetical protein